MKKILIVDDIEENLYMLESLLKGNGYDTISATNGAEALSIAEKTPPDIIVSDILMPVMDGYTLCRECKKRDALKNVPFVFYTATYTHPKDENFAYSIGADMFILKPQEPDIFISLISKVLSDFSTKDFKKPKSVELSEENILKEYNETLIRKLEDRMLKSEESEKQLRVYSTQLEEEIAQRKQIAQALKESEQRFRTLAENAPVGIFRTDAKGDSTYVNARWCEITQLKPEEVQGQNWIKAVHPDDRVYLAETWHKAVISKSPSNVEYRFLRKNGTIAWVFGRAVPQYDENNTVIGYIGTIIDITERKLMETDLIAAKELAEESDRLKTAFLHNISHEIRTPMNAIIGFSELVNELDIPNEKCKNYIDIIVKNSNQLLSIINDIISISTIETGQEKVYENRVNLNTLVKDLYNQFSLTVKEKSLGFRYQTQLTDEESTILSDETKLNCILSNLINNAIKYTNTGSIDFGYTVKSNELEFFVKDTGIGIPENRYNDIFKRFYQVEIDLTRTYGGSGLGLSISKAYVEMLGGKIWVTSKLNSGSTFYFTIPTNARISEGLTSIKAQSTDEKVFYNKPKTILIAEDEDFNYIYLCELLKDSNFNLIRAINGQEVIEIISSKKQVDLVLMDIKMPVMNGYEATRRLKAINPSIPVLAQTAYAMEKDKINALASGCDDYISKPYSKSFIISKINAMLQKAVKL